MILVTGATGNVGRELVEQLVAAGEKVRVMVRDERKVENLKNRAEIAVGDFDKPETLTGAMRGIERMFVLSFGPGNEQIVNAVAAAKRAGVRHVAYLSSMGAAREPAPQMGVWHKEKEQLIEDSGLEWTFLRPGMFMSNALQWAETIKSQAAVYLPTGEGKVAPIDPRDIAAVAATALTTNGHEEKIYELTGAELMTARQQTEILAAVLNKPIRYIDITPEAVAEKMKTDGLPQFLAEGIREVMEGVRSGGAAVVTQNVEQVTGRAPGTFEDWCRRHQEAFQ